MNDSERVYLEVPSIPVGDWFDVEDIAALTPAGALCHEFGPKYAKVLGYADILATDCEGPLARQFIGDHGEFDWSGYLAVAEYCDAHDVEPSAAAAYISWAGKWNAEHFEDSYSGAFEYEREADEYLVELFLECIEVPDALASYLDEDRIARDMRYDYYWCDGHLFRSC